ncbi:transglutaminase domain-containing protein [Candidatus Woesearchaeota archaeon]|nr:transglutaminase domain-containing protein [Candidatus Woesearchaeota archaeon]
MRKLFLLIIFLMSVQLASADWFYNSQSITANVDIYEEAEVVPTTPSGYIETATINMTFFPKQMDTQEILKFYTNPAAELAGSSLKFTFRKPEGKFDFRVNADVKTKNIFPEIRQKISFPIVELPNDIIIYSKPSETIDSGNEGIIRLASELVKGEDDLYAAVFKIADWTKNNINYNLSTLTAEVSQKASWVLENRQGVCDELTSLFIALLRAVGIPARFISGISYTNSELFAENWGAHGWAEVYFPGHGWVPFDVTYGEYGWVDQTHIKFKESIDSDEPSTYYQWLGRNADLKTGKKEIKGSTIEITGYYKTPLNLEASALKQSIGFGSYNLLTATVENPNDFYYATEIRLSKPKEVEIMGNNEKSILLLPKEKKKVFWILKLEESLNKKYEYTFPLLISTTHNITSEAGFTSSIRERYVSFEEIEKIAKLLEEEKEKKYSGNVVLDCKIDKSEFYEYESAEIYCNIKNTGNIFLEDLNVCFESACKKMDLGIAQAKNATFKVNNSITGLRESPMTLRNGLVSKAYPFSFKVNDIPDIEIKDLEFPNNVSYNDEFEISFSLAKKSQSNPRNVGIVFAQNGIEKKWSINELDEDRKFVLNFTGKNMKYGKNSYRINADYLDGLGKKYNVNKEFSIDLANAALLQRLLLWLNSFERISLSTVVIMFFVVAAVFIGLVRWMWRRK